LLQDYDPGPIFKVMTAIRIATFSYRIYCLIQKWPPKTLPATKFRWQRSINLKAFANEQFRMFLVLLLIGTAFDGFRTFLTCLACLLIQTIAALGDFFPPLAFPFLLDIQRDFAKLSHRSF
jgi:hypothetical protein